MAEHTLLIASEDNAEFAERISALRLPELRIKMASSSSEVFDQIASADIILAFPKLVADNLASARNLKWLQTTSVGVDVLIKPGMPRNYVLTNARGILGPKLTEYAFGHILAYKKRIFENHELQNLKKWDTIFTDSLAGETLVVLGTGDIGSNIAMVAKAFGMRTVGFRTKKKPVEYFDEVYGSEDLSTALSQGDYVVSVLPATPETNDIIRAETIVHMKDGVVFMNIGRGNAVNEEDVLNAVQNGKIARVVLDVFKKEPLPLDSPLWNEKNIVITPHMAGYAGVTALVKSFAENYERFRSGKELLHCVDFEKGY